MASNLTVKFHCTQRVRKSAKKSKHNVGSQCANVMKVLGLHPEFGVQISGFGVLRKMRVRLPDLNVGKSGGYRLIYRSMLIDEIVYVALLEVYFKGDIEDLDKGMYRTLAAESEELFAAPSEFDWDDHPVIPPSPGTNES